MNILGTYKAGTCAAIFCELEGRVQLVLVPDGMQDMVDFDALSKRETLSHVFLTGDMQEGGYTAGESAAYSKTSMNMRLVSHGVQNGVITTQLSDGKGHELIYRLTPLPEFNCFEARTEFVNVSEREAMVENLTAFALGSLSPFMGTGSCADLTLHRLHSNWSAEARLVSQEAGDIGLERAWAAGGRRVERFGSNCSMPSRSWMSTACVEDTKYGVTWGAQIYCNAAWQMEFSCVGDKLTLMGGGGDWNMAHWRKLIKPGESFISVRAVLTAAQGGLDEATNNLVAAQKRGWLNAPECERELPIAFNEWCTTWGNPTHENLARIADKIAGHGIRYMTIDAGWYKNESGWDRCMGDWVPNSEMFPQGLKATTEMIRAHGLVPGIWFEMESVGECSKASYGKEDLLIKRDGYTVTTGARRFWNLENPQAVKYLDEHVIGLLKECGFGYLKVDFNDTYGIGCDGHESAGEGTRCQAEASRAYFRRIRAALPELVIENCASGGHRIEPSMMEVTSQASFSDAHESTDIPIIAANLHRHLFPAQSQIWAVLHPTDSDDRLYYSLAATLLGRMCISGDVAYLSDSQWAIVDAAIAFYKQAVPVIREGRTYKLTPEQRSYRNPEGCQAILRVSGNKALLVVHRFEAAQTDIVLKDTWKVTSRFGAGISELNGRILTVNRGGYSADAYLLEK